MDALVIFGAKYLIAVPVLVLLAYLFFSRGKKLRQLLWLSVLSLPAAYALGHLAGLLYSNPRPFVVGHFKPLIEHAANNGFPSDHTLLAATLAMIALYIDLRAGIFLWIAALLIGVSRVAAGVHHALDIVGAMAFAVIAVAASQYLISRLRNR
jgi:undecaprenyl-diphosphatase